MNGEYKQIVDRLDALEAKFERLWLGLDAVRTHRCTYLGDGIALTYLVDETPFFINSNDIATCEFVNGGRYEQDNLDVIFSFLKADTVFLDIGANLGFFSLMVAKRITPAGKVHAFEPHPKVFDLMKRGLFLNGLTGKVECHNFGLSDRDAAVQFNYPVDHVGGGRLSTGDEGRGTVPIQSEVKRLDNFFDSNFVCDLAKIDVEGHELNVLRGMRGIVQRSPQIKVLFEKLGRPEGSEADLKGFFEQLGMQLYCVGAQATLAEINSVEEFSNFSGYVLATRPANLAGELHRCRFKIYPTQLGAPSDRTQFNAVDRSARFEGGHNQILFYGPYWFLRRGTWRIRIDGAIHGKIGITISERGGYKVAEFELENGHEFICERDLINFECVARAQSIGRNAQVDLRSIEFIRVG